MRGLILAGRALPVGIAAYLLGFVQPVFAHNLNERYEAPLPLIAYVGGAALAVAMSFVFVMLRNPPAPYDESRPLQPRVLPRWFSVVLRTLGLVAWLWVVAQTISGGTGDGDVASLFLWVFGWVGVALVSAVIGPIWPWLNPFDTSYLLLSAAATRLGLSGGSTSAYPERLGRWPAVIGFVIFVWLELVARIEGGRPLGLVLIAYTIVTLAAMSYFGRATWLARGETFSVWFGVLGRLAPFAVRGDPEDRGDPEQRAIVRRPFASGLLAAPWTLDEVVLIALGTGAIIFDGLTQTQLYFDLFIAHTPLGVGITRDSITGVVFIGAIIALVVLVSRALSVRAVGAGLLPVAVGYLVAHYLTYLMIDGQRIVAALNDPLLRGDNLLPGGLGFWTPASFLPTSIVWTIQLGAVIGGHIIGAWAGHAALASDGRADPGAPHLERASVMRQIPLAALMIALTSVTLWSLGQAVLVTPSG